MTEADMRHQVEGERDRLIAAIWPTADRSVGIQVIAALAEAHRQDSEGADALHIRIDQQEQQIAGAHDVLAELWALMDPTDNPDLAARVQHILGADTPDGECCNASCHALAEKDQQIADRCRTR